MSLFILSIIIVKLTTARASLGPRGWGRMELYRGVCRVRLKVGELFLVKSVMSGGVMSVLSRRGGDLYHEICPVWVRDPARLGCPARWNVHRVKHHAM